MSVITMVMVIATISSFAMAYSYSMINRRQRKKKTTEIVSERTEAFALLIKGYEQQTLNSESAFNIYKKKIADKDLNITYTDFLDDFRIYVREIDESGELTKGVEAIIRPIIEKEREEKPYPKVEDDERRLLVAIESSSKNEKGDTPASIKNNLDGLETIMWKKNNSLKTSKRLNILSYAIGIAGLLLTVLSFVRTPSISEKSINNLSKEISSQVDSIIKQNVDFDTIQR